MTNSPIVLSIIIVNYNSTTVLEACLRSIAASAYTFTHEVFIVDNASDERPVNLERMFPFVTLVVNTENRGFAFANNVGISRTSGKYVLLLNPDTIVNGGSLQPMVAYLDRHPAVGIVGCKIFNDKGEVEHSTHTFPTVGKEFIHANEFVKRFIGYDTVAGRIMAKILRMKSFGSYWDHDAEKVVDHVTGACMMVRREAIEKAGLLDEAFFLYNEEVEWSYRIKQAGYSTVFLPDSSIVHLFGHSTKQRVQKQVVNALLVERYRGMLYFFQKHFGSLKLLLLRLIVLEGFALRLGVAYIRVLVPRSDKAVILPEIQYIKKIIGLAFQTNYDWRGEP